ncbi:MAG TPA: vanadium-dependent haloperoxidase [Gemmatimonadaceae bacterium]
MYEGYAADPSSGLASLAPKLNGLTGIPSPPADGVDGAIVAAEAVRVVLDSLFRDGFASTRRTIDSLTAAQTEGRKAGGVSNLLAERSMAHGRSLGTSILAWAETDGFFATRKRTWAPSGKHEEWENTITQDQFVPIMLSGESDLVAPTNPGVAMELERAGERFVFTNRPKNSAGTTLPTFNPVRPTEPYWGEIRTFALRDGDECRPPAPPAYSEREGSDFWMMGKEFADSVHAMTPEKKQIALFWADNPIATGTPGFHWISVVNQMIDRRDLTAAEATELYALTSIAIADAFIGCWKEKYRSFVVRPVSYLDRTLDKNFNSIIPTPPFPEYTSGHSVQSAAAVRVLIALLGDSISFADSTQVDIGQPPRQFANFTAALKEVAISRVYAGVHYMPAVVNGMTQGECIGERVLQRLRAR